MHINCGLGEDEGAGVRHVRAVVAIRGVDGVEGSGDCVGAGGGPEVGVVGGSGGGVGRAPDGCAGVGGAGHLEETGGGDEVAGALDLVGTAESVDGVGEGVESVGVVEGLGAEGAEEDAGGVEGGAVVDVGVGLDDPDDFLAGVVEVELDLVGGGADGLVAGELELLDEVFVGILCHLAALVGVEENIVNIERRGDEGLLVGGGDGYGAGCEGEALDRPEALADGAEIQIDLDFVILHIHEYRCFRNIYWLPVRRSAHEMLPRGRVHLRPSSELIRLLRPITVYSLNLSHILSLFRGGGFRDLAADCRFQGAFCDLHPEAFLPYLRLLLSATADFRLRLGSLDIDYYRFYESDLY